MSGAIGYGMGGVFESRQELSGYKWGIKSRTERK